MSEKEPIENQNYYLQYLIEKVMGRFNLLKKDMSYLTTRVQSMAHQLKTLQARQKKSDDMIKDMDSLKTRVGELEKQAKVPVHKRFFLGIKQWWFLWLPISMLIGWVMDLLYKTPHP